jgi:putative RNA 2'-phosphotransferase
MDESGWVSVQDLLKLVDLTKDELDSIVLNNNKQRFAYSEDGFKIRARQGHSLKVDVELKQTVPPEKLFHGTATKNIPSILRSGLNKGNRLHVHLSVDMHIAKQVGSRHGKPAIFEIDSSKMNSDGIVFFLSENNVWLTDFVDIKYLSLPLMDKI